MSPPGWHQHHPPVAPPDAPAGPCLRWPRQPPLRGSTPRTAKTARWPCPRGDPPIRVALPQAAQPRPHSQGAQTDRHRPASGAGCPPSAGLLQPHRPPPTWALAGSLRSSPWTAQRPGRSRCCRSRPWGRSLNGRSPNTRCHSRFQDRHSPPARNPCPGRCCGRRRPKVCPARHSPRAGHHARAGSWRCFCIPLQAAYPASPACAASRAAGLRGTRPYR